MGCDLCGANAAVIPCLYCGGRAERGEGIASGGGLWYWCREESCPGNRVTGASWFLSIDSCECLGDDMGECDHCGARFYVWSCEDHCGECGQCFAHCHCAGGPNPHIRALVGGAA